MIAEIQARRLELFKRLSVNDLVLVAGSGYKYRSGGIFYPFHQNTDFLYFTGIREPDCIAVFEKTSKALKSTLFIPGHNRLVEQWDGPRLSTTEALKVADKVSTIEKFPQFLSKIIERPIYSNLKSAFSLVETGIKLSSSNSMISPVSAAATAEQLQQSLQQNLLKPFKSLDSIVHPLRLVKSTKEIEKMRRIGQMTGRAFVQAMKATKAELNEAAIQATIDYHLKLQGSSGLAYVPVVAGGSRALTIHYVKNCAKLSKGDLVLVDAGGELDGYSSDITRTWAVDGKFTEPQKQLYSAVLEANIECIKKCTSENSLDSIHELSEEIIKSHLESILKRSVSRSELNRLYPHHVGHYLGMDVHDTPSISRRDNLEQFQVVTVEPGLYIPDTDEYPAEFRGIGIRIEDNVMVGGPLTEGRKPLVLSAEAPKEILDLEPLNYF